MHHEETQRIVIIDLPCEKPQPETGTVVECHMGDLPVGDYPKGLGTLGVGVPFHLYPAIVAFERGKNITDIGGNSFLTDTTVMLDNTDPYGRIQIQNLGETGFEKTNPEVTSIPTVLLDLEFSDVENNGVFSGVQECKVSNYRSGIVNFSAFFTPMNLNYTYAIDLSNTGAVHRILHQDGHL